MLGQTSRGASLVQNESFAYVTCIFSGASGDAPLYKSPFRSQGVLGESFGSLFADAASLLAGFAALGGMPQVWVFVSMGCVRAKPLALTRACGGPQNKIRNGAANWSPEAAWGQEVAVHAKRAHPKPSARVVLASNISKYTWFGPAERQ